MPTRRTTGLLGLTALLTASIAWAQDAKPTPVPRPFHSFIAFDDRYPKEDVRNRTEKIHCLVCEHGLSPVVAVFTREANPAPDRPLGALVRQLNPVLFERRGSRVAAFVQFLVLEGGTKTVPAAEGSDKTVEVDKAYPDDARKTEAGGKEVYVREQLRDRARAFGAKVKEDALPAFGPTVPDDQKRLYVPLGLAPADGQAVSAYGIGKDDAVTVVLYDRLRVVGRHAFKTEDELTPEKIKAIVAEADALATGQPAKK